MDTQFEKLMNSCDVLNAQFQKQGIPVVVIPTETLLRLQEKLEQATQFQNNHLRTVTALQQANEAALSLSVAEDFNLGMSGGSPKPEHMHLCRDTAQDIINAKNRNSR